MFHARGPSFYELAQQALSSTKRGYDLLAPKFDYTPFRTPDSILKPVSVYLRTLPRIESAIDICCGTGAGMATLAKAGAERVAGLDFSEGMLEQARQNLARVERPPNGWDLIEQDVFDWEEEENYDMAVCFGALGHILPTQEADFVRRIATALRPGGHFIFVTSVMPPWYSPARIAAHGFNAAMHLRNAVLRPHFIMYYLTFLWPDIGEQLKKYHLQPTVHRIFEGRLKSLLLIDARRLCD